MNIRNAALIRRLVTGVNTDRFQSRYGAKPTLRLATRCSRLIPLVFVITLVGLFFAASPNSLFSRGSSVAAFTETIATFASSDCTTLKNEWNLGQTACAGVTGAPNEQRIVWIAPDGTVADVSDPFTGNGSDTYTLLTSGPLAQTGTWKVVSMDNAGNGYAVASFLVLNATTPNYDLSVLRFGPSQASAGGNLTYTIRVTNKGPDIAQNVVVTEGAIANATFVSLSGTAATCSGMSCTIESIAAGQSVSLTAVHTVNGGTAVGDLILSTSTVTAANELFTGDNTAYQQTAVVGTAPPAPCTISTPSDITVNVAGCSAVVNYTTPTASGNCADPETGGTSAVACNPSSGSAFPIGSTTVTCTAGAYTSSFQVTVTDSRTPVTPTISCPGDKTVSEDSPGSGSATVSFTTTATGNCVNVVCVPASGSSFSVGTTPVNCTATDSANNQVSCSFNVTVFTGTGCTLSCPGDALETAATGQCSAVVDYPDPSVSTTCGTVTCKDQNNVVRHSHDSFPVGVTVITCTSNLGPSCDFAVIVVAPAPPTITTCATNKAVPVNANCEGVIPNLIPEVVATGCNVTLSQSPTAGSVVPAGIYTVVITAENTAGAATCNVTVKVDTTPPVVTCPANVVEYLPLNSTATSKVVNYTAPTTATDNCDGTRPVTCSPAPGSTFSVGTTTVTCTATDTVGNTGSCSFTVTVLYNFAGFFSPVGNPPTLNTVNAGRAIPVKFSLSGNKGLNIFAAGFPVSGEIACDASAPPVEVTETLTAGGSSLSYDPDQYSYVWKTESSWAGSCRQLIIKLNDGSQHVANFKFR